MGLVVLVGPVGLELLSGSSAEPWWISSVVGSTLVGDQLVEPTNLTLGGLESEFLQFLGVAVEPVDGALDGVPLAFTALLDPATPTFEDAHPGGRRRTGKEG